MLSIYEKVSSTGLPHFMTAGVPVPTNLHLSEGKQLAPTAAQHRVADFLQFSFPAGFEGGVPSHSFTNHALAREHPRDVALHICMGIHHAAHAGPHLTTLPLHLAVRPVLYWHITKREGHQAV